MRIGADVGEEESANKCKSTVRVFAPYFLQQVLCRFIQSTDIIDEQLQTLSVFEVLSMIRYMAI